MINIHTLRIVTGQFTEVLFKGKKKTPKQNKNKQTLSQPILMTKHSTSEVVMYLQFIKKKPPITLTSTMVIDKNLDILNKLKKIYFFAQKRTNRKIQRQS